MNKFFVKLVNYTLGQVLVIGLVIALGYYFFKYDSGDNIRADIMGLDSEIAKEEQKKQETDTALKEEARMKEAVGLLSQQYQEITRRLPTALSSIELNRNIDAFARNSNVSIKARKPLSTIAGEIVEEVPIQITLEGSFAELAQFVYLVSASERITTVHGFTISPLENQKTSRLKFDGTVTGYQLAPDKPAPKKGAKGKGGAR